MLMFVNMSSITRSKLVKNSAYCFDDGLGPPKKKLCCFSRLKEHFSRDQIDVKQVSPEVKNSKDDCSYMGEDEIDLGSHKYSSKILSSSPDDFDDRTFYLLSGEEHNGNYRCLDCGSCFGTEEDFSYHLKCHNSTSKKFDCMECSQQMDHWYLLRNHLVIEHDIPILEENCKKCLFQTSCYLSKLSYQHSFSNYDESTTGFSIIRNFFKQQDLIS